MKKQKTLIEVFEENGLFNDDYNPINDWLEQSGEELSKKTIEAVK